MCSDVHVLSYAVPLHELTVTRLSEITAHRCHNTLLAYIKPLSLDNEKNTQLSEPNVT